MDAKPPNTPMVPRWIPMPSTLLTFVLLFFALLAGTPAFAGNSSCQLGVQSGAAIPDARIDGQLGSDWGDANELDSGSPCLPALVHPSQPIPSSVTVYSKTDLTFLYLAFSVTESVKNATGGSPLKNGDTIVLQFDPGNQSATHLAAANPLDTRIVVNHKWNTNPDGSINFTVPPQFFNSSTKPADSVCGVQDWNTESTPSSVKIAAATRVGGYVVEFKIPLASLGVGSAGLLGFAFAVVEDLGNGTTDDATAVAFPSSMALTNGMYGPSTLTSWCGDWLTPSLWGTAYLGAVPGTVSVSRSPVYWESESIQTLACGNADSRYYPTTPCQLEMQVALTNTTGVPQTRNLLYMWADHGSSPQVWRVISLQENVTIPPGGTAVWGGPGQSPFTFSSLSEPTSPPFKTPAGLAQHPCVRVYVLPAGLLASFPKSNILAISDATALAAFEAAYNLNSSPGASAQKNLSLVMSGSCPNAACDVIGAGPRHKPGFMTQLAEMQPEQLLPAGWPGRSAAPSNNMVLAQATGAVTATGAAAEGAAKAAATSGILLGAGDLNRYAATHVIVQVRAFGYAKRSPGGGQRYNFIEELGGVAQLFPVANLKGTTALPISLNVNNPGKFGRTIFLDVKLSKPVGYEGINVILDTGPHDYGPGETRPVVGVVGTVPDISCSCFNPKCLVKGAGTP